VKEAKEKEIFFSTLQCEKQIHFILLVYYYHSKHTHARSVVDKTAIERYGEMARRV
jgi:hypothetical protein